MGKGYKQFTIYKLLIAVHMHMNIYICVHTQSLLKKHKLKDFLKTIVNS